jgi:hypothetical protein
LAVLFLHLRFCFCFCDSLFFITGRVLVVVLLQLLAAVGLGVGVYVSEDPAVVWCSLQWGFGVLCSGVLVAGCVMLFWHKFGFLDGGFVMDSVLWWWWWVEFDTP